MIRKKPHIYLFRLYNEYYMYDVNTNATIGISKELCIFLSQFNNDEYKNEEHYKNGNNNIKKQVDFLKKQGFLEPINISFELKHQETDNLNEIYKNNLSSMILQVTQNCNLRCEYCVYSGSYINRVHNNKRMSEKTAIKAVNFLYGHSSNSKNITIGFYGGEPLLEWELIKKVVLYSEQKFQGKNLMFNITTNATLINEEIVEFMTNHNFVITISLDGPKDIQNKNRIFANNNQGTFDVIMKKLDYLNNKYPEFISRINFNAVIDLNQDVSCSNEFFMDFDTVKSINVSGNYINEGHRKKELNINPDFFVNSKYEIFKVFLYHCNEEIFNKYTPKLFDFEYTNIKQQMDDRFIGNEYDAKQKSSGGQCLPGVQRFFINVDGLFFPCERVDEELQEFCIGNLDDGYFLEKAKRLLNISQITKEECINCWAFKMCGQCIARANNEDGIDKRIRLQNCESSKYTVEDTIKNYIVLKNYGCTFD